MLQLTNASWTASPANSYTLDGYPRQGETKRGNMCLVVCFEKATRKKKHTHTHNSDARLQMKKKWGKTAMDTSSWTIHCVFHKSGHVSRSLRLLTYEFDSHLCKNNSDTTKKCKYKSWNYGTNKSGRTSPKTHNTPQKLKRRSRCGFFVVPWKEMRRI